MSILGMGPAMATLFVGIGLLIGTLFGFFGMGGSFLVTPTLLVFGFPATVAVGSGLAFVFGTSVVGALRHHDHGHIDYRLAGLVIVGMTVGVEVGTRGVFLLGGRADAVVSGAYVCLLALVGTVTLLDARGDADASRADRLSHWIQHVDLPPVVALSGGRRLSVWPILGAGVVVGILSGFLGVGGGFLLIPTMVYGFGVPMAVAAGTSVLQIAIPSAFGAFVYAQSDAVSLPVVVLLLIGSTLGARIGAGATELVSAEDITGYFAVTLFVGSLAVAVKGLGAILGIPALDVVSVVLLLGSTAIVSGVVVVTATGEIRG